MEDKGAFVYINKIKWIIIILIIIVVTSIIVFSIYDGLMTNKNTKAFEEYLLKNDFKKNKDKTYSKNITDNDVSTEYLYSSDESDISKHITETNDYGNTYISLTYKPNGIIEGTLQKDGIDNNGNHGILSLDANLNIKNSKFKCEIIKNQAFDVECNRLKKDITVFKTEVNKWLNEADVKIKYLK